MIARLLASSLLSLLLVVAFEGGAFAQGELPDDLSELEQKLAELDTSLSTEDCVAACEALASMTRAADKICELDEGPRCAAARERVEKARRRVLDACPDCAAAQPKAKPREETERKTKGGAADQVDEGEDVATMEASEGGCATCTVGHPATSFRGLAVMIFGVGVYLARRRSTRR